MAVNPDPEGPEYLAAIGKLAGQHAALDQAIHDSILDRFGDRRDSAKLVLDKVVGFEASLSLFQQLYHDAPDIRQTCMEIRDLNKSRNDLVHSHALLILDEKGFRTEIHNRKSGMRSVPSTAEIEAISAGLKRCGEYVEYCRETWQFEYSHDKLEEALDASRTAPD